MKKTIILTVCFLALIASNAFAKIWRVNNTAHDATTVLAGDTLHLEPSLVSYGSLTSTKKLIILGPGYFLNLNANQQANPIPATIENFTLNAGSSGTVISGLTITGNSSISTGNITIMRNNCSGVIYLSANYSYSNVIISGNYLRNVAWQGSTGTALITNVMIFNNYIYNVTLQAQFSGVIANNVIFHHSSFTYNFTIKNNICTQTDNSPYFNGDYNQVLLPMDYPQATAIKTVFQ